MRKKRTIAWLAAGALAFALAGCGGAPQGMGGGNGAAKPDSRTESGVAGSQPAAAESVELVVSAAASLSDSLQQLQKGYEASHPGVKLRFNFGASGMLQRQIEQGAPADLFIPAAAVNVQALVDQGLIDPAQQTTLLSNELVLVVPKTGGPPIHELTELAKPDVKRIAVGEPDSVPAGGYAKEALKSANLWDALQAKLVFAKDVRQVLAYVESGNADAGFVYKTDALTSNKVTVAHRVNSKLYKPITIPVAVLKSTKRSKEAQELYDYMQSKEAADIFTGYGFTPVKR